MSPALNGISAIRHFECSNAIEIRDGITFDFYTGLPLMTLFYVQSSLYYMVYQTSYIYMSPSYVLLHPFYIRWSLYIESYTYVLLWVHIMYANYCGVLYEHFLCREKHC